MAPPEGASIHTDRFSPPFPTTRDSAPFSEPAFVVARSFPSRSQRFPDTLTSNIRDCIREYIYIYSIFYHPSFHKFIISDASGELRRSFESFIGCFPRGCCINR